MQPSTQLGTTSATGSPWCGPYQPQGDDRVEENTQNPLCFYVKTLTGKCIQMTMRPLDTIKDLKDLVQDKEGVRPDLQRLVYNRKQLEDNESLFQHDVKAGSTIHLLLRLRGGNQIKVTTRSGREYFFSLSENARAILAEVENGEGGNVDQIGSLLISECPVNVSASESDTSTPSQFEVTRRGESLQLTTPWRLCMRVRLSETDTIGDVIGKIQARAPSAKSRDFRDQPADEQVPPAPSRPHQEVYSGAAGSPQGSLARRQICVDINSLLGYSIEGIGILPRDSVQRLKERISSELNQEERRLSPDSFDLVFGEKLLNEKSTFSTCKEGSKIKLMLVLRLQAALAFALDPPAKRRKNDTKWVNCPGDAADRELMDRFGRSFAATADP